MDQEIVEFKCPVQQQQNYPIITLVDYNSLLELFWNFSYPGTKVSTYTPLQFVSFAENLDRQIATIIRQGKDYEVKSPLKSKFTLYKFGMFIKAVSCFRDFLKNKTSDGNNYFRLTIFATKLTYLFSAVDISMNPLKPEINIYMDNIMKNIYCAKNDISTHQLPFRFSFEFYENGFHQLVKLDYSLNPIDPARNILKDFNAIIIRASLGAGPSSLVDMYDQLLRILFPSCLILDFIVDNNIARRAELELKISTFEQKCGKTFQKLLIFENAINKPEILEREPIKNFLEWTKKQKIGCFFPLCTIKFNITNVTHCLERFNQDLTNWNEKQFLYQGMTFVASLEEVNGYFKDIVKSKNFGLIPELVKFQSLVDIQITSNFVVEIKDQPAIIPYGMKIPQPCQLSTDSKRLYVACIFGMYSCMCKQQKLWDEWYQQVNLDDSIMEDIWTNQILFHPSKCENEIDVSIEKLDVK